MESSTIFSATKTHIKCPTTTMMARCFLETAYNLCERRGGKPPGHGAAENAFWDALALAGDHKHVSTVGSERLTQKS
jgi:hypothetical protein